MLLSKDFFWLFLLVARGVNLLSAWTGQSQNQIFRRQKTPSCCHGKRPDFYRWWFQTGLFLFLAKVLMRPLKARFCFSFRVWVGFKRFFCCWSRRWSSQGFWRRDRVLSFDAVSIFVSGGPGASAETAGQNGELKLTNPHWHKSANAWILKNGKKQILQVCSLHELTVFAISYFFMISDSAIFNETALWVPRSSW